ncbi:MAG: hypothetical protein R3C44_04735 [Chloroflexota bacterium]
MDSRAETEWISRFHEYAQDRTAIITHRFTTAMHADEIHVMEAAGLWNPGLMTRFWQAAAVMPGRGQSRCRSPCYSVKPRLMKE